MMKPTLLAVLFGTGLGLASLAACGSRDSSNDKATTNPNGTPNAGDLRETPTDDRGAPTARTAPTAVRTAPTVRTTASAPPSATVSATASASVRPPAVSASASAKPPTTASASGKPPGGRPPGPAPTTSTGPLKVPGKKLGGLPRPQPPGGPGAARSNRRAGRAPREGASTAGRGRAIERGRHDPPV
ncbi:MAG TPA: hypothetical protein VFS43_28535 [Polyangiaceae bacterium]|nr:hypothetical protein [Polyangiaceae bacterium]